MNDTINQNIQRCGLHIVTVKVEKNSPSFCYTIGFAKHGLPEQIVFSIEAHAAARHFSRYYDEVVNLKTREAGPAVFTSTVGPLSIVNAADDLARKYAFQAFHFAEEAGWAAPSFTQWVWCDMQDKFPWEKGYERIPFAALQPVLTRSM